MHFIYAYDFCIFDYLFALFKLWGTGFVNIELLFIPFHTFTYIRTQCTHSHREAVASAIGNLGEASSQLSWGVNLRIGP